MRLERFAFWAGSSRSGWRNTGPGTSGSGRTCWPRCVRPDGGTTSLFLTEDGLLVGYLETPDYQAAPDQGFKRVDEIFHLD